MYRIRSLLPLALALAAIPAAAEDLSPKALADKLNAAFPSLRVGTVEKSQIPGLYAAVAGAQVFYISADGQYALSGDILDLKNRQNLTEDLRSQKRTTAIAAVGVKKSIEFAPDKPKHTIYVFTDVDCGYCRKFHSEIKNLNDAGVAVRYLAFPRAGIGSESYHKAVSVWCADNPREALTEAKKGKDPVPKTCPNPVTEEYELGSQVGVQGTPTIVLESGRLVGGYMPAAQLVERIRQDKKGS